MNALTEWISSLKNVDPAIWLAAGAGMTVLLGFFFFTRRSRRAAGPVVLPLGSNSSIDWEGGSTARHDERRRAIRRGGLPTPILIVDPKAGKRAKASEAYVLDRSTGGLRLAMERPVQVGSVLLAKPGNAPDDFEWVKVMIRNCREVGDYYELGCQFDTDLELSRLLMFG